VLGVAFSRIEPPNPVLESGVVGDLDTMRERGAEAVKLSVVTGNDDAVRFYERLGLRTSMLEMMAPL
jgi:hypothetical protein